MGDSKESTQENKLEDLLSARTEADFRYEEDRRSHILQLNMGKTKKESEIFFTRL